MLLRYWNYEGKSSLPEERIDIIGILDDNELELFKNMPILIQAAKRGLKVQWDSNEYREDSVWDVKKCTLKTPLCCIMTLGNSKLTEVTFRICIL